MEMGFDEKEVMDALRVSNNQQSAAVSTGAGAAAAPMSAGSWGARREAAVSLLK